MLSNLTGVMQAIFSALATNPSLLLLAIVLIGIGYLMIRAGTVLGDIFQKHMSSLAQQISGMAKNLQAMADDLAKLSQAFEVHVVKTEYRIDTIEKRIDRLEKIHIKDEN